LDAYEVTVGRFRNFVADYPNGLPRSGDGRNQKIPTDSGWSNDWNAEVPESRVKLVEALLSCSESTYTETPLGHEFMPIGCVSWYLAYAFCAWDGGRLPSELEWDYAASGGELRVYPWSVPPDNTYITADYAVYTPSGVYPGLYWPNDVGSALNGVGKWGQYDLSGNMLEWLADAWGEQYVGVPLCEDCANLDWTSVPRVSRGGAYLTDETLVTVATRMSAAANEPLPWLGFRCAHDL
jgi:formylglycine-generating enzyme